MVAGETVRNILREHGIEPAPERCRRMPGSTLLKSHGDCIVAVDLRTVEIWSRAGLTRYRVLFFIKPSSRRVYVAGITTQPRACWMKQITRNVTDPIDAIAFETRSPTRPTAAL